MSGRNVVVTGLGLMSPHGSDANTVFDALMQGRSAIRLLETQGLPSAAVGQVELDAAKWFSRLQLVGVDRVSQLAVAASENARHDAAWNDRYDSERIGVFVGSGMGGATSIDEGYAALAAGKRASPLTVVASMVNAPAAHVAMRINAHGPVLTYSVACASSAVAIAAAARAIQDGDIDIAIACGSEALILPNVIRAWQALRTLATPDAGDPSASCRPFAENRTGFALSEGAAAMVLESRSHAEARGARIYAAWAGSGMSCDATHLTKPDVNGQARALRLALQHGGLAPFEVGYCNAHGTATPVGDVVECNALRAVWGDSIGTLRVSSTKSMHGHLLGAAGALEAAITVLALYRKQIPPTAHSRPADPVCAVPILRDQGEDAPALRAAISSSFAFGGTNVVLAFRSESSRN
jgi:3-oxoacyl-[acyl-carrier-protein] synthase II